MDSLNKTDRSLLPDDWGQQGPEDQYSFWCSNYAVYADILSDEALAFAVKFWMRDYKKDYKNKQFRKYFREIIDEALRRKHVIKVPQGVITFLVSQELAGTQ